MASNEMTNDVDEGAMERASVAQWEGAWQGHDGYDDIMIGGWTDKALKAVFGDNAGTGEEEYELLKSWDRQAGIMKIVPKAQVQRMTYSTQAYISKGLPYPQIQRIPISNLKVTPHQVSFDFFDTTEGKMGVSNATEKHYIMEFDVYVMDLIYFMWNHAGSDNSSWGYGFGIGNQQGTGGMGQYTGMRFLRQREEALEQLQDYVESNGKNKGEMVEGTYNVDGEGFFNWLRSSTPLVNWGLWKVNDWEQTVTFLNFRNTFLQCFTGWSCMFVSQSFGTVEGVFTEISYEVEDGFSDAKWHCKVEESLFFDGQYSTSGQKVGTSDGDSNNSG